MSGKRILKALQEVADFTSGRLRAPLLILTPAGDGTLKRSEVWSWDEYRALQYESAGLPKPERVPEVDGSDSHADSE